MPAKPKYIVRCQSSGGKRHVYLFAKSRRGKFTWGNFLYCAVYDTFEEAMRDAESVQAKSFQIVPVGYEGPPYWESKKHVKWDGPSAQYRNPRVFLIDKATGHKFEV